MMPVELVVIVMMIGLTVFFVALIVFGAISAIRGEPCGCEGFFHRPGCDGQDRTDI